MESVIINLKVACCCVYFIIYFQGAPFLMFRPNGEKSSGNERFEGYSIDLIDEIAQILGFKYLFELVPDGRYGSYNPQTKKWDGLVKQLLDRVSIYSTLIYNI
jgi:ionotropic kainate glutamate receptor 2